MTFDISSTEKQARALFASGDFAAAERLFAQLALALPQDPTAQYNLGVAQAKLGRFEEALSAYRASIQLSPVFADAYTNFGVCLNALNLVAQARQAFSIARQLTPENPIPILNEGIAALALGDYANGWNDFSARWQLPNYAKFRRSFEKLAWDGEELSGNILFLYAEQGFGDTIQMARFIPFLIERGAEVILEAPPALVSLLETLPGSPRIIAKGDPLPEFDFYAALMDVPRILGTELETIPRSVPYLFAEDKQAAKYERKLLSTSAATSPSRLRVGICWSGRSSHENDLNRSVLFRDLAPLFTLKGIEWVSLQRHVLKEDQSELRASDVSDWGQSFPDFAATAAAIATLDLVITVDTSVAHLAGALGKEVWILLPFHADWRWLMHRSDSPWYGSAKLFRQSKRADWKPVVETVLTALKSFNRPGT